MMSEKMLSNEEVSGQISSHPVEITNPFEENHGNIHQMDKNNLNNISDPKGPPPKKRFANDVRGSSCPVPLCSTITRKLKKHAFDHHLPSVFDSSQDPRSAILAKQRMQALTALTRNIKFNGIKQSPEKVITMLNRLNLVPEKSTISAEDEVAMTSLCHTLQLQVPPKFTLNPVNHVAALIHWRPLLHLVAKLPRKHQRWFKNWALSDVLSPDTTLQAQVIGPDKYLEDRTEQPSFRNPRWNKQITLLAWNEEYSDSYGGNEEYSGSYGGNEEYTGAYGGNEEYSGCYVGNEVYSGAFGGNEVYSGAYGANKEYSDTYGRNKEYSGACGRNEEYSGACGGNEKYSGQSKWNEQNADPYTWNGQYSGASDGRWNEQYPTTIEPVQMPLVSKQVPMQTVPFEANLDERLGRTSQRTSLEAMTSVRVMIQGGLCLYSDPRTFPSKLSQFPGYAVAVGIHPRYVTQMSKIEWDHLRSLCFESGVALGELGLDRTLPSNTWLDQDRQLKKLLCLAHIDMPVILHVKASQNDLYGQDVYSRALVLMQDMCSPSQLIQLHCFRGTREVVNEWVRYFPNVYFGFTELVACFDKEQVLALKTVPLTRLIVEVDAATQDPSSAIANMKEFITEVARNVAAKRDVTLDQILHSSSTNTQWLYRL